MSYFVARLNGKFWSNAEGYQPLLEAATRIRPEDVERFTAPMGGKFVEVHFQDEMPLPSETRLRGNPESTREIVGRCYPSLVTWDGALPQRVFEELDALCGEQGAWGRFIFAYPEEEFPRVIPITAEAVPIWEAWMERQEG